MPLRGLCGFLPLDPFTVLTMTKLSQWLASPDKSYSQGLELYHRVKRNTSKDAFFNQGAGARPGSLHFNLLLQELKNAHRILLAAREPEEKPPQPQKPITAKALTANKRKFVLNDIVDVKSLPPDMQKLFFRNQDITRELSGLHQELKAATSDKKRQELAVSIQELSLERTANWQQLDGYAVDNDSVKKEHPDKKQDKSKEQKQADHLKEKIKEAENQLRLGGLTKGQAAYKKRMITIWKKEIKKPKQSK